MRKEKIIEIDCRGTTLRLKTGLIATQADSSVIIEAGDTSVMVTVCVGNQRKGTPDFSPLSVTYRSMFFANGKIPNNATKREGKNTESEILISRMIDRSIRPILPLSLDTEVQIICTVMSYDHSYQPDVLSIIGASAALAISSIPVIADIAAFRIASNKNSTILNPSFEFIKSCDIEVVASSTDKAITMIEVVSVPISEEKLLDMIKDGIEYSQEVLNGIKLFKDLAKKDKTDFRPKNTEQIATMISHLYKADIIASLSIQNKNTRHNALRDLYKIIKERYISQEYSEDIIKWAFKNIVSKVIRKNILDNTHRIDGRPLSAIRNIDAQISLFLRTHGSAVFTRGSTQSICTVTFGSTNDEYITDTINCVTRENVIFNYIFPPYAVNEIDQIKNISRREIGHGRLALRALQKILPSKEDFPYTIRLVSEITESDGSSSMASVCAASLALMDAGVPIKSHVAGISIGSVKERGTTRILTDITEDEDACSDMDLKIAGSTFGITAIQMDVKNTNITIESLRKGFKAAKIARIHILESMNEVINIHRKEKSSFAPKILTIKINKDKVRDLIGHGGRNIREICDTTGAKIDIDENANVKIFAKNNACMERAVAMIASITDNKSVQIGDSVSGKITKIIATGAFVEMHQDNSGFIHISQISSNRIDRIADYLEVGVLYNFTIIGIDAKGRAKLSLLKQDKQKSHISINKSLESPESPPFTQNTSDPAKDQKQQRNNRGMRSEKNSKTVIEVSEIKHFS